jgi:AbrB family looped-hinge helix DNA binding protein
VNTTVTIRGQTVVPSELRKRYKIVPGDRLLWIDDGSSIRVVPVPADPIEALRGVGKGEGLSERLLEERARDRKRGS